MADDPERPSVPQATVVPPRRARISVVWIIPLLAAVVAIGVAVQRILSEGPTITIVFKVAEGLEAGKTFVKYKDVNIGQVTAVQLSPDFKQVEVKAQIAKSAEGLMVEDAKFWVVEPRITLGGVSGLGTLLSGNYIGFEQGTSAKKQRTFRGLDVPPVILGGQAGRQFVLKAASLGSLGAGAPVYYRSLEAGQVVSYQLASDGQAIEVTIFVNAPYDQYVNPGTRFWNASGIGVSVGAGGVDVRMESLVALIAGGVAFDTPPFSPKAKPATAMKQPEAIARHFVLYFNESLRGLSVGASVTLLGLPGGQVTDVGLDIDPKTLALRGRVEIVAYPERLAARLQTPAAGQDLVRTTRERQALFERLIEERGMRAQLRSGSLLTGQLYVAFDYHPGAAKAKVDWNQTTPVLPTVPSTVPDIEAKLTGIIAKLDKLPYEAIGADVTKVLASLNQTLEGANKAVGRIDTDVTPDLKATLDELRRVLASADGMIKNELNTALAEARRVLATADGTLNNQLNSALEELRRAIATADRVLNDADGTLLGRNAPIQAELRDALQEVARAARSLRGLTDYLERHPESLIRGKD
jgi:paraquat-inducible protein B